MQTINSSNLKWLLHIRCEPFFHLVSRHPCPGIHGLVKFQPQGALGHSCVIFSCCSLLKGSHENVYRSMHVSWSISVTDLHVGYTVRRHLLQVWPSSYACMHAFFNIVVYCGCGISCGLYLYGHTWPCHAFRENRAGCSSSCVWGSSCQSFDWEAQDHWLSPGREVGRLPLYQGSSPTYGAPDSMGKWRCGQCHYIGSFGAELSSHGHGGRFSLLPDQCGQTPGHQFLESSGLNPTPMEFVNFLGRVKNSCMHVYNCSCHVFNNQRFLEGVETSIYAQHAREPCCHTPWFMGSEEIVFPCSSSSRCWADGFWRQPVPKSCSINHSWVSHQAFTTYTIYKVRFEFIRSILIYWWSHSHLLL